MLLPISRAVMLLIGSRVKDLVFTKLDTGFLCVQCSAAQLPDEVREGDYIWEA